MTDFAVDWSDRITILRAPGKRLAKLVRRDGTVCDYDSPYRFNACARNVAGLPDLQRLLTKLLVRSDCCVVRGELLAGESASGIRRLAYRDDETGDEPTMRDVPRRWLALDADGIERPKGTAAEDLLACADAAIDQLPRAFWRTACIVQASGSHGIKPGCRLRLWYWCDRPLSGIEAKRWLEGSPFDPSVFRTVQPIYTAAPLFADGRADHLPYRLIQWPGNDWLRCPSVEELAPPPPKPLPPPERVAVGEQADAYTRAALIAAANAIVNAGEGKRHETIISESRSLARLVQGGLLTERDMRAVLARAAECAGKTDPDEVASCIAWGIANPSNATLPETRNAA
jgi:hypothetical protein